MLKGKQKNLDKNKDGKITGEDFKMMKAKYGKMMKARYGTMAKGDVKEGISKSNEFKRKLEDFRYNAIKRIRGAKAGPAEEAKLNEMMPSMKDSPSVREAKMKTVKMKLSKMKYGKMVKAKKGVMAKSSTGKMEEDKYSKYVRSIKLPEPGDIFKEMKTPYLKPKGKSMGGEMKSTQGYGAARTSGMGLQDEDLIPGKSMDYYKDLM